MKFDLIGFWGTWLDPSKDTQGQLVEVMPGIKYSVLTKKQRKKVSLFRYQDEIVVESEVIISENHPKTKVWLIQAPAQEIRGFNSPSLQTIYRRGCWRQGNLLYLYNSLPMLGCPIV